MGTRKMISLNYMLVLICHIHFNALDISSDKYISKVAKSRMMISAYVLQLPISTGFKLELVPNQRYRGRQCISGPA